MTKRRMALMGRAADLQPATFNAESRTVDLTWTTGARVQRRDFWTGEVWYEELGTAAGEVRMDRLRSGGAPLLDSHSSWGGVAGQLGIVERADLQPGKGTATVRLSGRDEVKPILADIKDGIIRNVSVGYKIYKMERVGFAEDGGPIMRATDWEPYEISLVSIPADAGAMVRGETRAGPESYECVVMTRNGGTMENENPETVIPVAATPESQRGERAERARAKTIRGLIERASLNGLTAEDVAALTRDFVDERKPVEEARSAILDKIMARSITTNMQPGNPHATGGMGLSYDDPETRAAIIGEAIFSRVNPSHKPSAAAREYMGLSLGEIARVELQRSGVRTTGMSLGAVVTRSLNSTSVFPLALGDAMNRTLQRAYEIADRGALRCGREKNASDFRTRHRIKISEAPKLVKVGEHAEFKRGQILEDEETYALFTSGIIFGATRQAITNDDIGVFENLPDRMGTEARESESQTVVDLLTSNGGNGPLMSDGIALFNAAHGNLALTGTAGAPSVETLGAARVAMRTQKGLSGRVVNFVPKFLLVPAALETEGEKVLTAIAAVKSDDANPFPGKLELVVDPRLDVVSAKRWYIVADADRYEGLEYAHLDSEPGPVTDMRVGFDVDGIEWRVRLDFGAGFIEHRSWYANPGV